MLWICDKMVNLLTAEEKIFRPENSNLFMVLDPEMGT